MRTTEKVRLFNSQIIQNQQDGIQIIRWFWCESYWCALALQAWLVGGVGANDYERIPPDEDHEFPEHYCVSAIIDTPQDSYAIGVGGAGIVPPGGSHKVMAIYKPLNSVFAGFGLPTTRTAGDLAGSSWDICDLRINPIPAIVSVPIMGSVFWEQKPIDPGLMGFVGAGDGRQAKTGMNISRSHNKAEITFTVKQVPVKWAIDLISGNLTHFNGPKVQFLNTLNNDQVRIGFTTFEPQTLLFRGVQPTNYRSGYARNNNAAKVEDFFSMKLMCDAILRFDFNANQAGVQSPNFTQGQHIGHNAYFNPERMEWIKIYLQYGNQKFYTYPTTQSWSTMTSKIQNIDRPLWSMIEAELDLFA